MKNIDSNLHVRGESVYVDDIVPLNNTLHAVVFASPVANGRIKSIDLTEALSINGVHSIITSEDIPGDNQIGGIIQDEPLLAIEEVHFIGQPIAIILAKNTFIGRKARDKIIIDIEERKTIVNPREAYKQGQIIGTPRTFALGDIDTIWNDCEYVFENRVSISGQEHLYLETQASYSYISEGENIAIISSTQGPTALQRTVAKILNIPMHKIEVDVRRLGGAFGGKEDQATAWGCMAALGTHLSKHPVKLILERIDDMYMTGKRHPYEADYKIGLNNAGKILGYEVIFYQNAGAAADLSPAVLERTLFHSTNSYFIPHVKATGISCKTNIPPNTAFRGFGGPQGMLVIEAAITHAAEEMGIERWKIQETNLIEDGDFFPYGQQVEQSQIKQSWNDAKSRYNLSDKVQKITEFNEQHELFKKGLAMMPVTFGISFTNTSMNQAGSLVHIYQDGSVGVSTGAVEMGQGVNTRLLQVPQRIFDLPEEQVFILSTNTTRVANTSPSAASSTHDLNGKATELACQALKKRVLDHAGSILNIAPEELDLKNQMVYHQNEPTSLSWQKLIKETHLNRIDLSEHAFYATPEIHFDKSKEKGKPFAYYAFGTAIIEVTVDCLRGRYDFDSVEVSHDFGKSMNPIIDLGQMEGGIVQGLGWMTTEELSYNDNGQLESNSLSTYKVPDRDASPKIIKTHFLEDSENRHGLFKSKAIGEPPLMYGIGGYFAIREAIKAFNPDARLEFSTPMTPEKVLLELYPVPTKERVIQISNVHTDDSK